MRARLDESQQTELGEGSRGVRPPRALGSPEGLLVRLRVADVHRGPVQRDQTSAPCQAPSVAFKGLAVAALALGKSGRCLPDLAALATFQPWQRGHDQHLFTPDRHTPEAPLPVPTRAHPPGPQPCTAASSLSVARGANRRDPGLPVPPRPPSSPSCAAAWNVSGCNGHGPRPRSRLSPL